MIRIICTAPCCATRELADPKEALHHAGLRALELLAREGWRLDGLALDKAKEVLSAARAAGWEPKP